MLRPPLSPRRRKRLRWSASLAIPAAGLVALAVHYPNTAEPGPTGFSSGPASVYVQPVSLPLTGARRDAARHVASAFLVDAVLREDPAAAWSLVTPGLRQGTVRADWRNGNIPVVPFRAEALLEARWRLSYSYADRAGFEVGLIPKRGVAEQPAKFTLELNAYGRGTRRHWLVSSWAPAPTLDPPPPSATRTGLTAVLPRPRGRLGATWLFVPLVIVLLALVVPVWIGIREWRRGVRAARRYAPHPSEQRGLSTPTRPGRHSTCARDRSRGGGGVVQQNANRGRHLSSH